MNSSFLRRDQHVRRPPLHERAKELQASPVAGCGIIPRCTLHCKNPLAFLSFLIALAPALPVYADAPPELGAPIPPMQEKFEKRVIATGLYNPHNMVLGPDGYLWMTEQVAKRVTRVHPESGQKLIAATIPDAVMSDNGQDGVLGLVLHPDLLMHRGSDFVYISMTYRTGEGNRTLIRRYTYDPRTQELSAPIDLIKGLPSSADHQSARLLIGPDMKLYYSIGDQGANQLAYFCVPNRAQILPTKDEVAARNWQNYAGKLLRMNLDGSIPADNPTLGGVKSHVYAWGFRNHQGLAFGPDGKLYATDHGPKSDDELDVVVAGKNYGWPRVAGRKDNAAYVYANWSQAAGMPCESLKFSDLQLPSAVPTQKETDWSDPNFVEPIKTFFTVDNDYNFANPVCAEKELYYICWPTIAPSAVAFYRGGKGGVPGWENSLLITGLKRGIIYRVKMNESGTLPVGDTQPLFRSLNRYRDIVVSPDGRTIYVITDSAGLVASDSGSATTQLENPGSVLAFTYVGQ